MANCSERRRHFRPGLAGILAIALVSLAASGRQQAPVAGEYGLFVQLLGDSIVVRWLTPDSVPGVLEAGPETGQRAATAAGLAHRAAVPRPRRDSVVLRYGEAGTPLHRTVILLAPPRRPAVEVRGVDSLYVVGDTHGQFDALVGTLRAAGLIGESLQWTGRRKHLVFAGDLTDRGPDVTRLLWFVYRLEREAARAGGRVHVVLGNHEIMDMLGDLRYLHPREAALARAHGVGYERMLHASESVLGRWLASKPGAIRVDGALIAHGGVATDFAGLSLPQLDALLAGYLSPSLLYRDPKTAENAADSLRLQGRDDFFWHPRSLFWFRDYVESDSIGAQLDSVLHHFRAEVMVVGHTARPTIEVRYDGRLIAAHTPRYGADLLLLVRERGRYHRFRIDEKGTPQPF